MLQDIAWHTGTITSVIEWVSMPGVWTCQACEGRLYLCVSHCLKRFETLPCDCHGTMTRGVTLLESVVLSVEPCTVRESLQVLDEPAFGVVIVSSRLLLIGCLRPKLGTSIRGTTSSGEEI